MDSTPKFASCSSCTDAGFGTALARHLGDCQIFDMYSNNILDLLGLTNLGTRCEDVVCKYEQVRELRFETAISFCILHFAFCQLHFFKICRWQKQTFPNAFTKSNCNPDTSVHLKSACTYQPWFAFHVSFQCLIEDDWRPL